MLADTGELAGVRALVVEDHHDNRELLVDLLSLCGAVVSAAASESEAFDLFQRERPDIVLSDVWMPEGDGLSLVRKIRALPPELGGLTPAIAITGGATEEQCLEAGFHYQLKKPVEPLVLLDCVRDFVRPKGIGRAQWSTCVRGDDLVLQIVGHVTATDMHNAISVLARLLQCSAGHRVVVDLRHVTGFDPSAGFVAETLIWQVRSKIRGVVIVGGSPFAQLVSRGACMVIGVACEIADRMPEQATRHARG